MKIKKTAYLESAEVKEFVEKYMGKFLAKKLGSPIESISVNDDFSVEVQCAAEESSEDESTDE